MQIFLSFHLRYVKAKKKCICLGKSQFVWSSLSVFFSAAFCFIVIHLSFLTLTVQRESSTNVSRVASSHSLYGAEAPLTRWFCLRFPRCAMCSWRLSPITQRRTSWIWVFLLPTHIVQCESSINHGWTCFFIAVSPIIQCMSSTNMVVHVSFTFLSWGLRVKSCFHSF